MVNAFPNIVMRFRIESGCLLVGFLLSSVGYGAEDASSVTPLPGPARIELEQGKIWLEVPPGYVYVNKPQDVQKLDEAAGRPYEPTHIAVVAPADLTKDFRFITTGPVEEAEWEGIPGPEWKQKTLATLKNSIESSADVGSGGISNLKVLGWYAEPRYTPGPPRTAQVPVLLQQPPYDAMVLTTGAVGTTASQIVVVSLVATETQAETAKQMDLLMNAVRFTPLPPAIPARRPLQYSGPKVTVGRNAAGGQSHNDWGRWASIFVNPLGVKLLFAVIAVGFAVLLAMTTAVRRGIGWLFGTRSGPLPNVQQHNDFQAVDPPPPPTANEFPGT